ncbi:DUF4829 domain-containing protein [Pelotomaculum isophthalicicum JI]|uniref:DUF4829 domain-containing protein n=1 Tax=Pelotomaculum isophthalicicum JI TaxID=947010 RepID=A0A9X4JW20_9FIRM|nr:DUF4829 domain-containing protein [Pelotomaculum isophthalicicum]MDF9408338.1 DUF4829 domain-containing protein [Pelotomaculum isophthalicicum JI]
MLFIKIEVIGMRYAWAIIFIVFILILALAGHWIYDNKQEQADAQQVLENYFKAVNDNNYEEQLRYLSPFQVNTLEQNRINCGSVPACEYLRINDISLNNSKIPKEEYLTHGRGTITKPYKVIIFDVDFELKRKLNGIDQDESIKDIWKYILIKQKENEPWKIDDCGV